MTKIIELFKAHKYAVIWTVCYLFTMWAILYFLFNFDMLNMAQWHKLAHAQLRGFAGFVFGLLILAALPLYIATTTLIVRNKKPLITITLPKIKIPNFLRPTPPAAPSNPQPTPESETPSLPTDDTTDLPPDIPAELRDAFIRARNNLGRIQTSAFNSPTITPITATPTPEYTADTPDTLPVPADFDITASDDITPDAMDQFTPTFTEINFDGPDIGTDTAPQSDNVAPNNSALIEYLNKNGQNYTTDGDIIITDTRAIITHADPDFWVADTDNWFAAGKVCPSPIIAVKDAATKHNVAPTIYLESTNILDIEKLIEQWHTDGITVITDPSEL